MFLKFQLNIGRDIPLTRAQRIYNGSDVRGFKPVVVNFAAVDAKNVVVDVAVVAEVAVAVIVNVAAVDTKVVVVNVARVAKGTAVVVNIAAVDAEVVTVVAENVDENYFDASHDRSVVFLSSTISDFVCLIE